MQDMGVESRSTGDGRRELFFEFSKHCTAEPRELHEGVKASAAIELFPLKSMSIPDGLS